MSRSLSRLFRKAVRTVATRRPSAPATRLQLQDLEERTVFDVNVTATVGTLGPTNYLTLKSAFDAINTGTHQGTITIDVVGDTTESAPAVINASGGASSYTSLLIRPSGGAPRTISGLITAGLPLIDFNGADNVTIDGLNTGGNALTISNTTVSATSGTSTIRFFGDATNNTITKSSILGSSTMPTGTNGGNIFFSTATATGNDNNIISSNNIGPAGLNLPTKLIYGNGSTTTTTHYNSGIQITGNNLFDYFNASAQSNAVYITSGNTGWTVSNNRIYQTATRTQTAGAILSGITVASANMDGIVISGNIIGFANSTGTGTTNFVGFSTASAFYPIHLTGHSSSTPASIQGNTIAGINITGTAGGTSTAAAFVGVFVSSVGRANIGTATGNTIGSLTTAGSITISLSNSAPVDVYGVYYFPSDVATISNNNVGGLAVSNSAAGALSVYGLRNFSASSVTNTFANNTIGSAAAPITNTSTATGSRTIGIYSQSGAALLTGNVVSNLSMNAPNIGTGASTALFGLWIDCTAATIGNNVSQNTVRNLSHTDATAANWVTGIHYNGATSGTHTIQRNLIYGLSVASTSATATINGIYVQAGAATYQNNMIALGTSITSTSPQINGINEPAGTDNFYHNSVYIGGTGVSSGNASSFAFNSTIVTNTRNFRDNIFYNARSNGAATGKHYAIRVGGTAASPAGLTSNNNILFASGTGGFIGLFNAIDQISLAAWQSATGGDAASISLNPVFRDPTNSMPDLHLHATNQTPGEGTGTDVGVFDDFEGQTRSGLTGTDIGADAGDYTPYNPPPTINYTPIANLISTSDQNLSITLADVDGVATGTLAPRLYFSKNAGSYTSVALTLTSGSVTDGIWSGTIDYSLVGGSAPGDIIRYFVVAQDTAGNLGSSPSFGFVGTDVNTVTIPPTTPNQYSILLQFAGTYNVGTGQTMTSLTNAGGFFDTISNRAYLTGNVTLNITSDLTGETGNFVLTEWVESGSGAYTILIKPSGAARTVSGSSAASTALIKLNGADRVTIDGSLSGGTDRSLTISNLNASGGAVVWIASVNASNGATNDTIKNTILTGTYGGSVTETTFGVVAGSGTTLGGAAEAANSNNTLQNNWIYRVQNSIFAIGLGSSTYDQNWVITNNTLGSTTPGDKAIFRGMLLGNAKDFNISNNTIAGVNSTSNSGSPMYGIQLALTLDGGSITGNKISDIKQNQSTGFGAYGIVLGATTTGASMLIANNLISDIASQGSATLLNNGFGIVIAAGSGYKLYNNTILLNTSQGVNVPSGITAALLVTSGVTTSNAIDMQNNIFAVTQNQGTRYGVYSQAAATVFQASNYNDYFAQNVGFLGSAQTTLSSWQSALGKDANSIAADPLFVSTSAPADLHVKPDSPVIEAGTVLGVTGVVSDIDGQPRDGKADIGGDETPLPALLGGGATFTYTENNPAAPIAPALIVNDPNSTTLASATVTLTGFDSGEDVLSFTANSSTMGNIDVVSNSGGVLLLASAGATADLTQWQAALRAVQYSNSSDAPQTASRTASFVTNDGYYDSTPVSMNVTVVAVNDVPVAQNGSLTTNEDKPKAFTVSKFNYADVEGDALASIEVVSLNLAAGDALTVIIDPDVGSEVVTAGMTITRAQIPTLTYTPAPNAIGTARSTFGFKVNDAGAGTVAATMTINVTAFNDAPVAQNSSVTTDEENTKTFSVSDFQFTDTESDPLASIKVASLSLAPGDSLTVDQGSGAIAVAVGMAISATEISTITYTPDANANGTARGTFDFTVNDADSGTVAATMSINVTPINDVPVAQPSSVTTSEDTPRTFVVSNFPFNDVEGNALGSIKIVSLNLAAGDKLTTIDDPDLGPVDVTVGMTITRELIATLVYTPAANVSGAARSTFDFAGNDADAGTSSATMTMNVTAANDPPVAQPSSVTINEETTKTFAASDFSFNDTEGDALATIKIGNVSLAEGDALTVDLGSGAVAVTTGMTITAAQISTILYTPAANANGVARSKFDFAVNDADLGTTTATMTINVTDVNDVPVALPSSLTTNEDTAKAFTVANFPFTDLEGDTLTSITIASFTLADGDSLSVDQGAGPVAVTTGMTITSAQLPTLTYTPAPNANGLARSSFGFRVNDTGLGTVPSTVTINVSAVNDVPVAQTSSVATTVDTVKTFAIADFLFTDLESDSFVSVTVSNLNLAAGDTLTVNQGAGPVAVANGMTITTAQIPTMTYTPALGGLGMPRSLFDFTVNDAGLGTLAATMSVNTTPLSDIQFESATFTVNEDDTVTPVRAHVVVTRSLGNGPVDVNFATVAGGTALSAAVGANPQDYTATTQPVHWDAGDFSPKTVEIPINYLTDTLNEGRETINLTLSTPIGNARLGAQSTAVLSILPSDGIVINGAAIKPEKPQALFTDEDGDVTTVKFAGKVGSVKVYRTDTDGNGEGPIELIEVIGTEPAVGKAPAATLSVTTVKGVDPVTKKKTVGDGLMNIGGVIGTSLKSITAAKSDLDGDGIHLSGFLGAVTLRNVLGGADISADGTALTTNAGTKITVKVIEDNTDITLAAPLANLTATRIGDGNITAPSIGSIKVTGDKKAAIIGDFLSDIHVGKVDLKQGLATLSVAGSISNVTIDVDGNVGSITAGTFVNSTLYAGYNSTLGVFRETTVGSFTVKGTSNAFDNSNLYAATFNKVILASLKTTVGGPTFGVTADTAVKSLVVSNGVFKFDPKNPASTPGKDNFEVKIV